MRFKALMFLVIVGLALPTVGVTQWLHYPMAGAPRKADGPADLTAPAPRLSDGKPDSSGIWHATRRLPCNAEISRFIPCHSEIGGSPQARNFGVGMPAGLPYQPWAAALVQQRTPIRAPDASDDWRAPSAKQAGSMSKLSRRKLITSGLAVTGGATGLVAATRLARLYGLIPPDAGGLYGPGETLTYARCSSVSRRKGLLAGGSRWTEWLPAPRLSLWLN